MIPSELILFPSNGAVGDLTWRLGDLFGDTRRGSAGGADRFHHPVMPTSGVEGAGEIVYLLRHPVVGMTEELMGDGVGERRAKNGRYSAIYLST